MSGNIEILLAGEPAAIFVGIGHAFVPARCCHKVDILRVELHVQVREALVEVERHTVRNLPALGPGVRVLLRQRMDVTESQERGQKQPYLSRSVNQVETYHDLIGIRHEQYAFREHNLPDLIGDFRDRVSLEIDDVLVAARLIDITVAVDTQIELFSIKDETFIQRGQEQVRPASESVNRHCQQAMIAPCVASHYGSVAVGARLVGTDDLPLQ